MKFSSKAGTLCQLVGKLHHAQIPSSTSFSYEQWSANPRECLAWIDALGKVSEYVVRSSASGEDSLTGSKAGLYLSLLSVSGQDLRDAVESVFASYGFPRPEDEVLVQPLLRGVLRSGVAFTHDQNGNSPYRVVNWHEGPDTSFVTGGRGGRRWVQAAESTVSPPASIAKVLDLLEELLPLFQSHPLDVEFAVTEGISGEEITWLLQVRPLILRGQPETNAEQTARLSRIENKINDALCPHPFLFGDRTAYGVMPDWNPAEILGIRPYPLALSLYRSLVTDSTWAYQRHNYGYRNLRSFPLMLNFCGQPYIDVRVSFNSFIPADIEDSLAKKLVNYYLQRLLKSPSLHDKVEFEIVYSCYTFDINERLKKLSGNGFSQFELGELVTSLKSLTNRIIHPVDGIWRLDYRRLDSLVSRRERLLASEQGLLDRIYWLLEDCRRYGTLPFAGLARAGFIAVQLLDSLVATGVFNLADRAKFMSGLATISRSLVQDKSRLTKGEFLEKYGHLRPGTYNLLSPRYDQAPHLYFDWECSEPVCYSGEENFCLSSAQGREIDALAFRSGLSCNAVQLIDFIKRAIELRELAKFLFSTNLSDALELIKAYGEEIGVEEHELQYLDVSVISELYVSSLSPRDTIIQSINIGKARYLETQRLILPPLIQCGGDVWAFEEPESKPNYVTLKSVTGRVISLDGIVSIERKIVLIPNADPGFDWIFSHNIAGFITAWGGSNSHMAIRAGELGLPAAIGIGELRYSQLLKAKTLLLDCCGQRVQVIS